MEKATESATVKEKRAEKRITKPLQQFGYDLFAGEPTTFAPVTEVPIPTHYVLGPGDVLQVLLMGKVSSEHQLEVNRDGNISFPGLGLIQVVGMRFKVVRELLDARLLEQMVGVRASITMGRLRSIRVFVLGDVQRPGSYTVSALSTMTNAMFVSGGITKVGSLRNIQLKRGGETVTTLDLYDLLLRGDTGMDVRIQPGDVLFVPPVGKIVGVGGEVARPALYELNGEQSVAEMVEMAGGLLSTAYSQGVQIERLDAERGRVVVDLNLKEPQQWMSRVKDGDVIKIYPHLDKVEDVILLTGQLYRPGFTQWFEGVRLSDVIQSKRALLVDADRNYVIIKREEGDGGERQVLTANLNKVWGNPGAEDDPLLKSRDQIIVLTERKGRMGVLRGVVNEIVSQNSFGERKKVVTITGNIRNLGTYPFTDGMTARKLVDMAMGVLPETDMEYALLRRVSGVERRVTVQSVSLREVAAGGGEALLLEPEDELVVLSLKESRVERIARLVSALKGQETLEEPAMVVRIGGNVEMPGEYPLTQEMKVRDLIVAARHVLPETDMEYALLRRVSGVERRVTVQSVSLREVAAGGGEALLLEPEDELVVLSLKESRVERIAKFIDELKRQTSKNRPAPFVEIHGAVRFPGQYPLEPNMVVDDLIQAAGGLQESAYSMSVEVTTRVIIEGERVRETRQQQISLDDITMLNAYDSVRINHIPFWNRIKRVMIGGEVMFPGEYTFTQGETLMEVMQRAGGMTEQAFPQSAVLMRTALREKEQQELEVSAALLEKEIALLSKQQDKNEEGALEQQAAQELLEKVKNSKAMGRLSIKLDELLIDRESSLVLKEGDHLVVPTVSQEVTVMGEVFYPTSHFFKGGKSWLDYVNLSGGVTKFADDESIYIIRADGSVTMTKRMIWFRSTHEESVHPGDTVVVPVDLNPTDFMSKLKDIAQVLYQLATTTAVLQTVGVF